MTNRDDNDDSTADSNNDAEARETPSSLGIDFGSGDSDAEDTPAEATSEDPTEEVESTNDAENAPAIGGQASESETDADDDPTRNIPREKVRETLMGMPAQGDDQDQPSDDPDTDDPDTDETDNLPSSQSLLEEPDEPAQRDPQPAHAEPPSRDDASSDDETRDVPVEDAQQATSDTPPNETPADDDAADQKRETHETMMGMGAANPQDAPADDSSPDDPTSELDEDDWEEVGEPGEFQAEKTMVSSSPFESFEEESPDESHRDDELGAPNDDDLPDPAQSSDPHADTGDFGEAELDDDADLEEYDDYEKTVVSDDVLEGPPSDNFDEPGLDVTSSPDSPATDPDDGDAQPAPPSPASQQPHGQQPESPAPAEPSSTTAHHEANQSGADPTDHADQPGRAEQPRADQPGDQTTEQTSDHTEDDDFSSQKTEIFSSPFENDPVCPKLTVLEGPSSGQEYLLNETRNTIGRSTKNSVVVPDESMSRQHLEIVKRPDGTYRVQDLQSVNGTYLNGEAIEEADIFHGDRVRTGRTTVQFLIPGDAPQTDDQNRRVVRADAPDQAQPQAAPGQTRSDTLAEAEDDDSGSTLNRIIAGAAILCTGLLGVIGYLWSLDPGPTPRQQQAHAKLVSAIDAIRSSDWNAAESRLNSARELAPNLTGIDTHLQRLETEREAYKALQTARSAAESDNHETAIKQARAVPRSSVYFDEARDLLRRQQRARQINQLLTESRQSARQDDRIEALSSVEQILKIAPTHSEALQLRHDIKRGAFGGKPDEPTDETDDDAADDADGATAVASTSDDTSSESTDRAPRPTTTNTESASAGNDDGSSSDESDDSDDLWLIEDSSSDDGDSSEGAGAAGSMSRGFELYKNQRFDDAISHFETISESGGSSADRASTVASHIADVQSSLQKGNRAVDNGNWSTAASAFRSALRADKKVDDAGHLSASIQTRIAESFAGQGRSDLESGNYADAFDHYKSAREYDSEHGAVRSLRQALEDKASSLYVQAANSKKTNPAQAATLCRTITSMVPPDSDSHKKAESLLDEL